MALSHALLAALLHRPSTGYDLARQFDGSVGFFWKATHQQIYRELGGLQEQGWLSVDVQPQTGKPDRKVYSVTGEGRRALGRWIETPAPATVYKDELLVKIFAGPVTGRDSLLAEVRRHQHAHQERLDEYHAIEARYFPEPELLPIELRWQYLTLLAGIGQEKAWLHWFEQAQEALSKS